MTEAITQMFEDLKSSKQVITDAELLKAYDIAQILVDRYIKTGQKQALAKLIYTLKVINRERTLVSLGYNQYVYKDAIDWYIDNHQDELHPVKIIELREYTRTIPEDIVKKVEETKNIFDEFFVVFTDYTGKEDRRVEATKRNRDPILFGVFLDTKSRVCIERFYYIGDWVDEYCDLTFDKFLTELGKSNFTSNEVVIPKTEEELTKILDDYHNSGSNLIISSANISSKKKESIFSKIKNWFTLK